MKRKLFIFTIIAAILFLNVPLYAEYGIIDNAELLSAGEKSGLETLIKEIAVTYNFELIILTEKGINGENPIDYSWKYLDSKGLYGDNWDGCLFLQSIEDRDYCLTASRRGENILNDASYDKLEKDVSSYLHDDDYAGAYRAFINDWKEFLALESNGRKYTKLRNPTTHLILLAIAWAAAALIAIIKIKGKKKRMNSVFAKSEADAYIIPGSLNLTQQFDRFLYSTTTKIVRQSSSGSGNGGNSRSSRSSGGRSSRSGKY